MLNGAEASALAEGEDGSSRQEVRLMIEYRRFEKSNSRNSSPAGLLSLCVVAERGPEALEGALEAGPAAQWPKERRG